MNKIEETNSNKYHMIGSIAFPIIAALLMLWQKIEILFEASIPFFLGVILIKFLPYNRFKLVASIVLAISSLTYLPYLIGFIVFIIAIFYDFFTGFIGEDSPGVAFIVIPF